jgi:hypothetical protein
VARQVAAFRRGVNAVFGWRRLLAFGPQELADMVCGAGSVEWTDKSLKKLLRPAGGFGDSAPTVTWLRQELLAFTPPERRSFLKFATAVPRLVPGLSLTVACKGSGGGWLPTAQTCTPQLNLAVYTSRRDLASALREAMANADADGGFHERAAGSDGNTDDAGGSSSGGGGSFGSGLGAVGHGRPRGRGGGGGSVQLPSSMRSSSGSSAAAAAERAAAAGVGEDDDEDESSGGEDEIEDEDSEFDGCVPRFGGEDDEDDDDDAEGEGEDDDEDDEDGEDQGILAPAYAMEGMLDSEDDEDDPGEYGEGDDEDEVRAAAAAAEEAAFFSTAIHGGWNAAGGEEEDDEDEEDMNDL